MKKIISFIWFCMALVGCKPQNTSNLNIEKPVASVEVDAGLDSETNPDNVCQNVHSLVHVSLQTSCEWEMLENPNYEYVAKHNKSKTLLTIKTEKFDSTYDHFVLTKLRTLRNNNVNVDDIDETKIDDVKFLFVQADKEDVESWHFFGWKNKVGYTISCGGQKELMSKEECQKVFDQIKLK